MSRTMCAVKAILACVAACGGASEVRAAWLEIDTFETIPLGPLNSQNGWTGNSAGSAIRQISLDPADTANQVFEVTHFQSSSTISTDICKAGIVAAADVGTLYFRFRMKDFASGNGPTVGIGLDAAAAPSGPTTAGPWLNLIAVTGGGSAGANANTNTINAFNPGGGAGGGGTTNVVSNAVAADTWYQVWMVLDNANDTYEAYIQGGAFATQTQLGFGAGPTTTFNFRQTTPGNLINVWIRPNQNNNNSNRTVYFDDIYLDPTSENLATPVPEPIAALLAGLAVAAATIGGKRARRGCFASSPRAAGKSH